MRIALTQGSYTAPSIIANAQRCVNLYPERNPDDSPVPFTHYSCPGLVSLMVLGVPVPARGLYRANSGDLYYVAGNVVYYVDPSWVPTSIGTITPGITTPVSFADNGTAAILVDGSGSGWQIDLNSRVMTSISSTDNSPPAGSSTVYAFYGANRVDMLDGYAILNYPGTQSFYCTYNNEIVFDATYLAEKNGFSDILSTLIVNRREIWLIGQKTTEIWFDAGNPDFPFAIIPGPFVQHGTNAIYSVAQIDGSVFFLSEDQAGNRIVARGEGYAAERISTHALEAEFAKYPVVSDAVGFCYQQFGHSFYFLTFPSADKTWVWDETTKLWHERVWIDDNGSEHRHRAQCAAFAYDTNIVADWQTGEIYKLDLSEPTDAGQPRTWRRGFPHLMADGRRASYPGFVLDIQPATVLSQFDINNPTGNPDNPFVWLRWSDDRGRTWGNPISQSLGALGKYLTQVKWWRTGMARDRVFEVYGTIIAPIAINGAFLDPEPIPFGS